MVFAQIHTFFITRNTRVIKNQFKIDDDECSKSGAKETFHDLQVHE